MKTDLFQSCGHCWVFQICWHIECSTFTASSFRIWNSSTGIPSPPLALFVVMLSKAHLTSHSRMSDSRWVITLLWLSGAKVKKTLEPCQCSPCNNFSFNLSKIRDQCELLNREANYLNYVSVFFFFLAHSFFKNLFNWRTIALWYCVDFCHTSAWISHRYIYVPSLFRIILFFVCVLRIACRTSQSEKRKLGLLQ